MIKISRDSGYADATRAYKILLDGEEIGKIKGGETRQYDVKPGNHSLQLKIDWASSRAVEFKSNKTTVEFLCGSNLRGWRMALSLLYITFLRNDYSWLRNVDDK